MIQPELEAMLELLNIQREWTEQEMILAVMNKDTNEIDKLHKVQSKLDTWIDDLQDIIIDIRLADPDEEWVDEDESYIQFLEELEGLGF